MLIGLIIFRTNLCELHNNSISSIWHLIFIFMWLLFLRFFFNKTHTQMNLNVCVCRCERENFFSSLCIKSKTFYLFCCIAFVEFFSSYFTTNSLLLSCRVHFFFFHNTVQFICDLLRQ